MSSLVVGFVALMHKRVVSAQREATSSPNGEV